MTRRTKKDADFNLERSEVEGEIKRGQEKTELIRDPNRLKNNFCKV